MNAKNVAVVGATGAVGIEILRVLERRCFACGSVRLFASKRSAATLVPFMGERLRVEELRDDSFRGVDVAFFAAGNEVSRRFVPCAVNAGAVVVDNSSAFRMDEQVPLVIPEINLTDAYAHAGIIANPNCSTIILLMGVYPIHQLSPVSRIIVSTYQSVSGSGARAIEELLSQSRKYLDGVACVPEIFPHPIAFNLFSHNSAVGIDGYNAEETKMIQETRKILKSPGIQVNPTCVRVPVLRAHCESVTLELKERLCLDKVREALDRFSGVRVLDRAEENHFPMPLEASEQDEILVGRLRHDSSHPFGISLFIAGDQLLKGAALNAVQIAERLFTP